MKRKGFTLIELVMVIAILGILAAMVLPRFINLQVQANRSAAQGALGAIRSAVAVQYASNIADSPTATFPAAITATLFQDGQVPRNPVANNASGVSAVATNYAAASIADVTIGWMYAAGNGRVWANWSGADYNAASTW